MTNSRKVSILETEGRTARENFHWSEYQNSAQTGGLDPGAVGTAPVCYPADRLPVGAEPNPARCGDPSEGGRLFPGGPLDRALRRGAAPGRQMEKRFDSVGLCDRRHRPGGRGTVEVDRRGLRGIL